MLPLAVFFIGGLLFFGRALTRVLRTQRSRNNQHFAQRLSFIRFQEHASDTWIDRQSRHFPPGVGHITAVGNSFQFL